MEFTADPGLAAVPLNVERRFLIFYIGFVVLATLWSISSGLYNMFLGWTISHRRTDVDTGGSPNAYRDARRTARKMINFISWLISTFAFSKVVMLGSISNYLLTSPSVSVETLRAFYFDMITTTVSLLKSLLVFVLFSYWETWRARLLLFVYLIPLVIVFAQPVVRHSFYYTQRLLVVLAP